MKSINYLLLIACLMFLCNISHAQNTNESYKIQNPIIPGFNPDPCITRVGSDYYIVTSTFEWFPGIPIYHSKDLVNWTQIGHVLTRKSQLDLTGTEDADGVFAPSITYHKGLYYISYTIVQRGLNWAQKGYPNYIVTAKDPKGPWSEPTLVNGLGFDPTLFIDEDERAYFCLRITDRRAGKKGSPGMGLHEIDLKTLKPKGDMKCIYKGWIPHSSEAPKILKKDGYYYLFTADGGTGYGHMQGVARSKNIWGPYEKSKDIFYTAKNDSTSLIQKSGHGTLVQTQTGEWYTTHLGSRPLEIKGNCPLGRETFIQKVNWTADGWPVLSTGEVAPAMEVEAPNLPLSPVEKEPVRDDFTSSELGVKYQTLREPANKSWLNLDRKKGFLSLRGRRMQGSYYEHSLLAQRLTSFNQQIETSLEFNPINFRQSAGLTCYYNTKHFYSLSLTFDEKKGKVLELIEADGKYKELLNKQIEIGDATTVYMKIIIHGVELQYYYSLDDVHWSKIGPVLDFGKISDDYAVGYTGAMVGLFIQDMMYENTWAEFDYFEIKDIN